MYQHAKDLGISQSPSFPPPSSRGLARNEILTKGFPAALITISHRPSLFKYHHHLLRLTGHDGIWETSRIGTEAE